MSRPGTAAETSSTADRESTAPSTPGADGPARPILEAENLTKYFDQSEGFLDRLLGGGGTVKAVDGVDLALHEGETLAVVGESGCGKTTLGETLLGLQPATGGSVRFRGEELTGLSRGEMRPYRRRMQIVFQDPLGSLNPRQTVGDIVKAPMEVHDIGDDDAHRAELVEQHLVRVGLKPGHVDRYPGQFSGGQQQRVGVARALAVEPDLLVADEPVSALDVSVQAQILNLLDELQADLGLSMLFITHDLSVVHQVADRVAVMYLGEIVETAPVDELFADPRHPYTRSLLSAVPRIDPAARTDRVILEGTVPSPIVPPVGCRFHTRCPAIVPGDGWPGDQASFRRAFTFRTRVEAGELDPGAVRARLAGTAGEVTDDRVADRLVEATLPGDPDGLPDRAATAVREAARYEAVGDHDLAVATVREALPSPCVADHPRTVEPTPGRTAACHRVDPGYDADEQF